MEKKTDQFNADIPIYKHLVFHVIWIKKGYFLHTLGMNKTSTTFINKDRPCGCQTQNPGKVTLQILFTASYQMVNL